MAVNVLLSYAFHGPRVQDTDLAAVRKELVCGRLMLDSGAFTAHNLGKPVRLTEYAGWLEQWRGCWDAAVTLDEIGDPVASARNTRRLHERGLPVAPVFTKGGRVAEFDAMIKDVGYVCVGGLVGKGLEPVVRQRLMVLQRRARDLGGGIHALGVTALKTLRPVRPFSSDASKVSNAFLFGTIIFFDGQQIRTASLTDGRSKLLVPNRDHITALGIDLAPLLRTRRLPNGSAREELVTAMSLAYACADESIKRQAQVPVPHAGVTPGTGVGPHIFNSITPSFAVMPAARLDRMLHSGYAPRAWLRYGRHHVCNAPGGAGPSAPVVARAGA